MQLATCHIFTIIICIVFVHFCFLINQSGIDETGPNWSTIGACPSLSFVLFSGLTGVILKGLTAPLPKFVFDVCSVMYVLFYVCV